VTKKFPKLLFRAPKHTTVSPTDISDQGQAGYQEILVKTKTSPKGLGAAKNSKQELLANSTETTQDFT
jgi:hypothetical protein